MNRSLLFIIKDKKDYYKYLKENSFLIRDINRYDSIAMFENFIKDKYKLRISDKINDAIDTVDMVSTIVKEIM